MKNALPATRHAIVMLAILSTVSLKAHAQLWRQFAHGNVPHMLSYDIPMSIPDLIDGTTDQIILPVLIIPIQFSDVGMQSDHTAAFYNDLVFGTGNGDWTANHLSVAQIIEANSNGRLLLIPAIEWDGAQNDGVVGPVTAQCPPGSSGSLCVEGDAAGQSCDPGVPGACEAGGGHCEACDTWEYYRWNDLKKRAEAIRRADEWVDFSIYDTRDRFWNVGQDDEVRSNEIAVLVIHARPNCTDPHEGHADWGTEGCGSGTMRATDPSWWWTDDGVRMRQHPSVITEAGSAHTLAHELSHQIFGTQDLYGGGGANCNPRVRTAMGSICSPCTLDDPACNDACADAACVDDMAAFESTSYYHSGSTGSSSGTDESSCAANDLNDVWFTYTPAYGDDVEISLCSSDCSFDTVLSVLDGCNGNQLNGACSDDFDCTAGTCNADFNCYGASGLASPCDDLTRITIPMSGGATYWIRVSSQAGATGSFRLRVTGGGGTCDYPRDSNWYPQPSNVFSMMSNQGTYEPHLNAWTKLHLGFIKPQVVTQDGTYTIHDAETDRSFSQQDTQPEALVIYDPMRADPYREYFIVENRKPTDYWDDTLTVDSGLAIWHIHDKPFPGDGSVVSRRAVHLIRPGIWSPDSHGLWDGADAGYYDLTPTSTPKNTHWVDDSNSYIEILDISPAGPVMTLKIRLPGVFVDAGHNGPENGSQQLPYNTVTEGIDAVDAAGGRQTIRIEGGTYSVGSSVISTQCTLAGWQNGPVVIGQ